MNFIKNKIKAIIFDMDGTIIDTSPLWENITRENLYEFNINCNNPDIENFIKNLTGISENETILSIKEKFNLKETIDQLAKQRMQLFYKNIKNNKLNFIDGFEDFHKKLNFHNFMIGLATNSDMHTVNAIDEILNLNNFFGKHIYSAEQIGGKSKPDPSIFLLALKELNAKPEECIIFEDSLAGFQAAKKASIKCIAIKSNFNKDFLHHADYVIENYNQAEEAIKKII